MTRAKERFEADFLRLALWHMRKAYVVSKDQDAFVQEEWVQAIVKKARTDAEPLPETVEGLADRPEAYNLVGIYAALADMSKAEVLSEYAGSQFSTFKPALTDLAVEKFGPIGAEMKRLMADPTYVDSVLKDGAERANTLAAPVIREVKETVGFLVS